MKLLRDLFRRLAGKREPVPPAPNGEDWNELVKAERTLAYLEAELRLKQRRQ